MTPEEKKSLTDRLRRVIGQMEGTLRMVENDKPCDEVMIQISSAKGAIQKTGQVLLETYLRGFYADALNGVAAVNTSAAKNSGADAEDDEAAEEPLAGVFFALEQFSRIL
ncbi:MAG: metal-sensitive transcriptional regulator [Oscillospiraceae bacterium]|jgi:DNA-binding FrmR family transcriptional regulator|nr:metal-sensitive transcriptional regulator [Oscillospiraceae bacterium]